ncbi:putative lipoprotein [Shewanella baltica OS195]|uniref:Putative lipoprotein n=2 Tax=Shewanellaceae TaxID=267890 RepID=A9L615_SHEB9|nr:putative lipoprotein [Shewanella baltica OS195]
MMNLIKLLIVSAALFAVSGCGYNSGVKSEASASYLYFTGTAEGVDVSIDNVHAFTVTKTGIANQYRILPGKHLIVITRNNQVIVKRELLLGDGHEKEIYVP